MSKFCIFVFTLATVIIQWSGSFQIDDIDVENERFNMERLMMKSWEDELAEQLQEQINKLRKDIQKVKTQTETAKSIKVILDLNKELDLLKGQLESNILRIDQFYGNVEQSKELRQRFQQKFDQVRLELMNVEGSVTDRAVALDNRIQNAAVRHVIGAIKDGQIGIAVKVFKTVENSEVEVPRIVKEAYTAKGDPDVCKKILKFINAMEPIEKQPHALDTLFEEIQRDGTIFTKPDCVLGIAYQTKGLLRDIGGGTPLFYLWGIRRRLPLAAHMLNTFTGFIFLGREKGRCQFKSEEEERDYLFKGYLGDLTKWEVEIQPGGEFYRFRNRETNEMMEGDKEGRVYPGSLYNNGPKQHWKPILKSNEQVALVHRETGMYLGFETVGSCYKYKMGNKETRVYLRI